MIGLQPVVLDDPAANVALALAGVAGEQRRAVVDLGDAAAERRLVLHLGEHVDQEQQLAVAGAGDEPVLRIAGVLDDEARVLDLVLAAHPLQVGLPALAVRRIGEHEVELARREGVLRKRRAVLEVLGLLALALEQQVGLGDGVGLGVDSPGRRGGWRPPCRARGRGGAASPRRPSACRRCRRRRRRPGRCRIRSGRRWAGRSGWP